jgi:tryptophanyl-tRNA synthetase
MKENIIVSGIQPSGELHIGNYLGALRNFVKLQEEGYRCTFFIADLHSMTIDYDPKEKARQTFNLALDYLAAGIDPKKSTIFVQSQVPACTELTWILNTVTPIAELTRMTQFKDKSGGTKLMDDFESAVKKYDPDLSEERTIAKAQRLENSFNRKDERIFSKTNMGLLDYPVLMAADILLYKAAAVPVGQDQFQHLELTRKIARFFNNRFGDTFQEPKEIITSTPKIMSLTDPTKKMSKSHGPKSYIAINDSPEVIENKIRKAVSASDFKELIDKKILTTSKDGLTGLTKIEIKPADTIEEHEEHRQAAWSVINFSMLLDNFGTEEHKKYFNERFINQDIRFSELKKALTEDISEYFRTFREKRTALEKDPEQVKEILRRGAEKAGKVAEETMQVVRKKTGLLD